MSFFTGGGATLSFGDTRDPSSFPQYGNRWRGGQIVEEGRIGQQTDMTTKEVIMRNGKPAEQLMLPLLCDGSGPAAAAGMRTDERNPNDHTDTGRRTLYIKGSLRYAVGDALRAVQAEDLDVGGYLFVMWTGMGKTGNSTYIGRTWQVHYIKPTGVFLNNITNGAPGFQNQAPPGAMPVQQNAQGQYAPQHTGFAPTQQPVTAPPPQGWNAAPSAPVTPPNPYGQHNPAGSPAANAAQQWSAQQAQPVNATGTPAFPANQAPLGVQAWTAEQHQAYNQQHEAGMSAAPAGYVPPTAQPQWQGMGDQPGGAPMGAPQPAAPSNPWGAAPDPVQSPQAPYGPPAPQQGTPQPGAPTAGNPWGQQ